jgi:predicted dehydrogenase
MLPGFSAKSYSRIIGANERIMVSIMGVNGRGTELAPNFARQADGEVAHICDVDPRAIGKCIQKLSTIQEKTPKGFGDFRRSLEQKEIDVLVVSAPDHWHAPAALLAMQAGKNVYLEKPCSHNPWEGGVLIKAAARYGKSVQMGNQRRSWPVVMQAIEELKSGTIGRPYFGKSWYTANRPSIGKGNEVPVPEWLDWDLWQGPAPRKPYFDNYVHYNWHWFWHWGTGESLNNGTHMVDLLRWGLGLNYPVKVSSNGGRYRFKDDQETPDTQVISWDFQEGITMTWENKSCNGKFIEGSSVGAMFFGENGSLVIPQGNAYTVYDLNNKVVKDIKGTAVVDARNTANPSEQLDAIHIRNFFDNIKQGTPLNSNIESGHKSTLLVQLGNIAQRVGHSLSINPMNGNIINDTEALKYWSRTYEKGWEMKM